MSNFAVVKLIATLGTEATAVFGIFARVLDVVWMMGFAFEGAMTTLVGQSLGSGNRNRAWKVLKIGLLVGFLMGGVVFAVVLAFPGAISRLFSRDSNLIDETSSFLRVFSPGFVFMFVVNVVYGTLVGGGRTIDTFLIGLMGNWPVKMGLLSLAVFLSGDMEKVAISLALTAVFTALAGTALVFRSRKWMETQV